MTTAEFCEFCDKVEAYACTDLGVRFIDLEPRAEVLYRRLEAA